MKKVDSDSPLHNFVLSLDKIIDQALDCQEWIIRGYMINPDSIVTEFSKILSLQNIIGNKIIEHACPKIDYSMPSIP